MSDKQFLHTWTHSPARLSTEGDAAHAKLRRIIDAAYDDEPAPGDESANPPIEAMLAGFTATVVTVVLFAVTLFAGTPGFLLA